MLWPFIIMKLLPKSGINYSMMLTVSTKKTLLSTSKFYSEYKGWIQAKIALHSVK